MPEPVTLTAGTVAAGTALLQFGKGLYDTATRRGREKQAARTIGKQIRGLESRKAALPEFFDSLRNLASEGAAIDRDRATIGFESSQTKILDDLLDIRQTEDVTKGQTNLEFSGTAAEPFQRAESANIRSSEDLKTQFTNTLAGLDFNLKSQNIDISRSETQAMNALTDQIYELRTQRELYA